MTVLEARITGDAETMAMLRKLGSGVINLSKPMSDIGTYLASFFAGEVFASRGGVIGEPWQSLNQRYAAQKAKSFPGRPPLVRTGVMQRSFKKNAGRMSVTIFNSDRKFDFHQGGTRYIPPRVMMKVDRTRANRVVDIVEGHLQRLAS